MKKLVTLFLAAGMLLTSVAGASAIEFRPSGEINVGFFGSNTILGIEGTFQDRDTIEHNGLGENYEPVRYQFKMEYALNLDFIASEQLTGRIGFVGNDRHFAQTWAGATEWNDAFYVNVAYIDWYIPNTPVEVRLGRWKQGTTNFTGTLDLLSPSDPQDGVRLHAKINDNVSLTGIWWRLADGREDGVGAYDSGYVDQFFVEAPLTFDGVLANVWFTYIRNQHSSTFGPLSSVPLLTARYATWNEGTDTFAPVFGNTWEDARIWAFGGGFSLSKFSPFVIAADFGYSNMEVNGVQFRTSNDTVGVNAPNAFDRKGWYLSGRASFNTVYGTPSLFAWYTSGDDDDLSNGSERPFATNSDNSGIYSLFGSDRNSSLALGEDTGFDMAGTWGLSAQWSDLSFVEGLNHHVALTYIKGTNDPAMAKYRTPLQAIPSPYEYMTSKDSAVALELSNSYEIYEELTLALDMFYVWQNFDNQTWSTVARIADNELRPRLLFDEEVEFTNTWGIGLSFNYAF